MESYHPTVWRTCRVLANTGRIKCLKVVLEQPGRTVCEIAACVRIAENLASEHLRALQARGLIQACRKSRWVHYAPVPDPLVPSARPLLTALRQTLLTEKKTEPEIIHTLTAFTHPRRLAILRYLQKVGYASADDIAAATRISLPALSRHLSKLTARRLASCEDHRWQLTPRFGRLEKTLLSLLVSGKG